jgi:methyl-accepting chemotaxis protein
LQVIPLVAEATINHDPLAVSKILGCCKTISNHVAHFTVEVQQKHGNHQLNEAMSEITGKIQGLIKDLQQFANNAHEADQKPSEGGNLRVEPSNRVSAMVEIVNAEAEVLELQRQLKEAVAKRDRVREGK